MLVIQSATTGPSPLGDHGTILETRFRREATGPTLTYQEGRALAAFRSPRSYGRLNMLGRCTVGTPQSVGPSTNYLSTSVQMYVHPYYVSEYLSLKTQWAIHHRPSPDFGFLRQSAWLGDSTAPKLKRCLGYCAATANIAQSALAAILPQ
jgi:hypothetical protein